MEKNAFGGDQANNMRARAAPMIQKMPIPAAAAPAPPPNRMKPDDDAIVADGEPTEDDF